MKKLLIAGVASVALAAIPVVSSFAETASVTDNLVVSLHDTCAFDRSLGTGEYAATLVPGTYAESFSTSTFTVTCNNPDVYTVTATFTDLTQEGSSPIVYSTADPSGAASTWTARLGETDNVSENLESGGTVLSTDGANGGGSATVRYAVGVASDQDAGSYRGRATYTLVSGY